MRLPHAATSWFGDRAVAVVTGTPAASASLSRSLATHLPGLSVRAGMDSVLIESREPDPALIEVVQRLVLEFEHAAEPAPSSGRLVVMVVAYDGEDVADAAAGLGCTPAELVAGHQRQEWEVAMMGFAPGFAYLVPRGTPVLDWERLARRDRPRERVAAGSVAIAAGMSAIYPGAMPGGWHLIGRTDAVLFDSASESAPTALVPGDVVRFRREGG